MAFLEIDSKQLYYDVQGSGRSLVLVHSALAHSGIWDDQMPVLADQYQVVRYDLYGYGQSAFTDQKKINHVADLKALLEHLNIAKATVLGMSMGAEMVIDFALAQPQMVEKMILVGSGLGGYEYPETGYEWWGDFVGAAQAHDFERARDIMIEHGLKGKHTPLPPVVLSRIKTLIKSYDYRHYTDDSLLWAAPDSDLSPAQRLAEITCPTLVMLGSQEHPVVFDVAAYMLKHMPNARQVTIPDAAHWANLSNPEAFNQTVLAFMAE